MQFNEPCFLHALVQRPELARSFSQLFQPEWLNQVELIPILETIYEFTAEHGTPPSFRTLHEVFEDKDQEVYEVRMRRVLQNLEGLEPDVSQTAYALARARDAAVVRSVQSLYSSQAWLEMEKEGKGQDILKTLHRYLSQFADTGDISSGNIRECIDELIEEHADQNLRDPLPTEIDLLDRWSEGGLRPGNLAIVIAPTGTGKSALLLNIAHRMAVVNPSQVNVWFVSNELSRLEQTERFLARMSRQPLPEVWHHPALAYQKVQKHWTYGTDDRLRLTAINREHSTDEMEAILATWRSLEGWKPRVLVLDFMERMRPTASGYQRDKTWTWLGGVAQDLVRMAKRHNIIIWTAAQANRSGLHSEKIRAEMAQSSIQHLQEASLVVGMQQRISTEGKECVQFSLLKARHARARQRPVALETDMAKMLITDTECNVMSRQEEEAAEKSETDSSVEAQKTQRQPKGKREQLEGPSFGGSS